MNLSRPQIRSLLEGSDEISKLRQRANSGKDKKNGTPSGNFKNQTSDEKRQNLGGLLSALGGSAKMTPKAREKMQNLAQKKSKSKE